MSAQISEDGREGFFDAVRQEAVATVYSYWAEFHQAVGIERAAKLTIDRIAKKRERGDLPEDLRWHYKMLPQVLTVRRRIEEGAKKDRYAPESPPLRCIGLKQYQGQRESQYQPFEVAV